MNEEFKIFMKEIQYCSYGEKYHKWQQYLKMQSQSDNYLKLLSIFLQYFPFNYQYWLQFIKLTKFQSYTQSALQRNPKSYDLWNQYLRNCKLMYFEQDRQKYKRELEKGLLQIGADSRALPLFQDYYELISQNSRYQFFKKMFTRALKDLQTMHLKFQQWFDKLPQSSISTLAVKEFKSSANQFTPQQQKIYLKQLIDEIYKKTLSYRDKRLKLQKQIHHLYFDGSQALEEQKYIWRELIQLERDNGIVENISYVYQRSLMALTDDVQLWDQVFHYMENQTNKFSKVLDILRNNKVFFLNFDLNIYFYWCDLEQRLNVGIARSMYQNMANIKPQFQVYQRWIQLQIRDRKLEHARKIYEDLLIKYRGEQKYLQMLCYIVVEYSEFVVKHYKELDSAKKILKIYFDNFPFNHYLFTKYLEFLKNFQNNQGFYEDLMQFITDSLIKAKKTLNQIEFNNLNKIIKFYLRSTLSSIYLIKMSQHAMMEVIEKIQK